MTAPATQSTNRWDGKSFLLQAIDDKEPGAFYIWPTDKSIDPMRIHSSDHGYRYRVGAKGETNDANYEDGPWVGGEMIAVRARLGGAEAGVDQYPSPVPIARHDDGTVWSPIECASFRGPIQGGPNTGPDLIVKKLTLPPPAPAPSAVTQGPSGIVIDGGTLPPVADHPVHGPIALVPVSTVAAHQSIIVKLRDWAGKQADHTAAEVHKAVAELEQVWTKWTSAL